MQFLFQTAEMVPELEARPGSSIAILLEEPLSIMVGHEYVGADAISRLPLIEKIIHRLQPVDLALPLPAVAAILRALAEPQGVHVPPHRRRVPAASGGAPYLRLERVAR